MMAWMMPAMRSSTPACERGGGATGACVVYADRGVGARQLRALAHRRELSAALLGTRRGAAHEDARADACEEPADRADRAGP